MLKRLFVLFLVSALAQVLSAADEKASQPVLYKSAAEWMATLAKSTQTKSGQSSAAVSNQDHYRVNIVRRDSPGVAMAHDSGPAKGSEVHYIIDGAATVVTGGTLTRQAGAAAIEGGQDRRVTKGDVIVIPAGTPHWYKEIEGSVTYLEVRFDVELGSAVLH